MSIASRITVTWTPSANAQSQDIQRATSASGPWTTIASGLSAVTNSYVDESTVDNPFTGYYYKIITYCSGGVTVVTNSGLITSANCPNAGALTIFGLWSTNGGLNTSFNYFDYTSDQFGFTGAKTVPAPAGKIRVVCHTCGQTIQPTGTFASYGDISYMSNQGHMAEFLPVSPTALGGSSNSNMGTVYRKIRFNSSVTQSDSAYFGNGSGNTWSGVVLTSGTYSLKNYTQVRIGRYIFGTTTDQTTGLNSLNPSNLYVAVCPIDSVLQKCEVYIYQASRNANLDFSTSSHSALGFNLTYVANYVISNNNAVYSFPDTPLRAYTTQTNAYFKFFNL